MLTERTQFIVPLLMAIICLAGVRAFAGNGDPSVAISCPRHDAGSHWEGEIVSNTFEVTNKGSAELKILRVKPG